MKSSNRVAKKCIFILLCIFIVLMSASCEKNEVTNDFHVLNKDIAQLQTNISTEVTECQTLLLETNADDLFEPILLEQLKTQIESAQNISFTVPTVASDISLIKQQNQELTAKKEEFNEIYTSIIGIKNDIQTNKQEKINQIAAEREAAIQDAITPKDFYTILATDDRGNQEKITVCIGKWIKGSESDTLEKAWSIVGGSGSMPLTGTYSRSAAGLIDAEFTPKDAAYVFGTVSIENMTPDFDAINFRNGLSWVYLNPIVNFDELGTYSKHASAYLGEFVQAVQYGNNTMCEIMWSNKLISASMESNNWGPVPFVIGADTVFSPQYPDGDPKLDNVYFYLSSSAIDIEGDTEFQIGRTW